jgi:hypothetical protein
MDPDGEAKLRGLRADFEEVTGKAFSHFYCPVLFRDEDAELCRAHIVNEAFSSVGRHWTVQRKDVDGFYGRCFESDFVDIQYQGQVSAGTAMVDKTLGKKFRPKILVRGHPVPYYYPPEAIPAVEGHSKVHLEGDQGTVEVHLKLTPKELETTVASDLEIRVERDLRLPALVSLIKVAHLTLFSMLGYRYALSAGGHFMGRSILGEFYLQNYRLETKRLSLRRPRPTSKNSPTWCDLSCRTNLLLKEPSSTTIFTCAKRPRKFPGHLWCSPERRTHFTQ